MYPFLHTQRLFITGTLVIGQVIHFVFGRDGSHVAQEKWQYWQNPFKSRNIFTWQSQPVPAAFNILP
jgi:hypothetical protein